MLARNRELARAVAATLALAMLGCVACLACGWRQAAVAALAAGIACPAPLLVLTWWRYRRIARLSASLDEVLHGERELELDRMSEGELAILESELSKMVTRLEATAEDLRRESGRLADALADISHQIRTPLTSLALDVELLRKDLAARGGAERELERIRRIERLQARIDQLVQDLLTLARLDAGAIRFESEPVDVSRLVADALEPLAVAFEIAEVEPVAHLEDGCSFTGDASWAREALANVLKNCLEHTPAGGEVRIEAYQDALACRIRVTDTGPGIAEEALPHVFERFWRDEGAQAAGSPFPAGVGIGLPLARALVAGQGGALTARNVLDGQGGVSGACFEFAFFKVVV